MSIYAIADLHLSIDGKKAMDVFGGQWEGYMEKIKENWKKQVQEEDTVVIRWRFLLGNGVKRELSRISIFRRSSRKENLVKRKS